MCVLAVVSGSETRAKMNEVSIVKNRPLYANNSPLRGMNGDMGYR